MTTTAALFVAFVCLILLVDSLRCRECPTRRAVFLSWRRVKFAHGPFALSYEFRCLKCHRKAQKIRLASGNIQRVIESRRTTRRTT